MNIRIGTETDKEKILNLYPHTSQVISNNGYLIIAEENEMYIGFAFVFRRKIPAPIGDITEDFINVVEVFNSKSRCNGVGSAIIQKCIETGRNNGSYQLRAYCDINNIPSHKLWLKNKFGISPVKMPDNSIAGSFVTFTL